MFNPIKFLKHRGTSYVLSEKPSLTKRECLGEILKILSVCEITTHAEAAKFSKENLINRTDEEVNIIYKKLKLLQWK